MDGIFSGVRAVPDTIDIVDISFVKRKEAAKGRKDRLEFMNTVIEGGVHWRRGGAHACASELEPPGVTKLEDVVNHAEFDGIKESVKEGLSVFMTERGSTEEFPDDNQGMHGVDVGIHRDRINSEEACTGGKEWELLEVVDMFSRAGNVGWKLAADGLEFTVGPNANPMENAAADRGDGPCCPRVLMDLKGGIKVGIGVFDFKGASQEGDFLRRQGVFVSDSEGKDGFFDCGDPCRRLEVCKASVGHSVKQVVIEAASNVNTTFDDCRTQVFISFDDHECFVSFEKVQHVALGRKKVWG